eukprot:12768229-Alexandrium_andersonii.AAC.1
MAKAALGHSIAKPCSTKALAMVIGGGARYSFAWIPASRRRSQTWYVRAKLIVDNSSREGLFLEIESPL